jgi:hypothetical protein
MIPAIRPAGAVSKCRLGWFNNTDIIGAMISFLLSRWRGQAPLETVFWRDMIVIGTAINIAAAAAALGLLIYGASTPAALAVHFGPVPWNFFLFLSVYRSADNAAGANVLTTKAGATLWLVLMLLV